MLAFLYTIAARIRGFLRPGDLESDFDEEVASHLEMAEEDGLRRGLTVEEARRTARVQLGGITQLRESQRVIDRVVAKGVLHRNAGDRHKSRLAHALRNLK